jgi:hypothetical protein
MRTDARFLPTTTVSMTILSDFGWVTVLLDGWENAPGARWRWFWPLADVLGRTDCRIWLVGPRRLRKERGQGDPWPSRLCMGEGRG